MESIRLPRVVVTARAAEELTDDVLPSQTSEITVYARAVAVSSDSFANRLVERLAEKNFTSIQLKGSSRQLHEDIRKVIAEHPQIALV